MPTIQQRWDAVGNALKNGADEAHIKQIQKDSGLYESPTAHQVRHEITERFLTPRQRFPQDWLQKSQVTWTDEPDYARWLPLEPSQSRTRIEFVRTGLDGLITGYKEVIAPGADITAKNSTSLLRKPAPMSSFVRGKAGQYPFAPGGLEAAIKGDLDDLAENLDETLRLQPEALLSIPPGFSRGLNSDVDITEFALAEDEALSRLKPKHRTIIPPKTNGNSDFISGSDQIDDLLPTERPLLNATPAFTRRVDKSREWAHVVDVNQELTNFYELVPDMAHKYPFELDNFQKEAVYHLENGDSVFVAAHTSAGKTVVAEYAIALASKHMTRAIYTSPIKALSNQKFRDFKNTFEDVGILTGDVQINPEASCLIMTTEILRSMLYRGADLIRDVEFVIFDEVHYVNDLERGVVWEEVIIMLPEHVNLILLSATVPNTKEFADWVGRTKQKDIYVISTPKRPVPLEHHLYAGKELHKIVDAQKQFLSQGWKSAKEAMTKKEKAITPAGRGDPRGRGRGSGPNRGRGAPTAPVARGRGVFRTSERQDRNLWIHLVGLLRKRELLPVVVFTFSKKRCEENAASMPNTDLCSASEKSEIHIMIEKSLTRLRLEDKQLPQILKMRDLLSRGVGVHHGGLLPIVKEVVELLFARGLVKVLFATETFAMGVNMPARTVVFSGIRKHDGRTFRDLLPGEYTQMSGRAGRRGLDATGMVIIVCDGEEPPDTATLHKMLLGEPTKLASQFRLTYNMILNLLRVEALRVEEMIKRSFSENASQRLLPEAERKVLEGEKSLSTLKKLDCEHCLNGGINDYYDLSADIVDLSRRMIDKAVVSTQGMRLLSTGRIVVIVDGTHRYTSAVILKLAPTSGGLDRTFWVLTVVEERNARRMADISADVVPPRAVTSMRIPSESSYVGSIVPIPHAAIAFVTRGMMKVDGDTLVDRRKKSQIETVAKELYALSSEMNSQGLVEVDWSKVRDLDFQETYRSRNRLISRLDAYSCVSCPEFEGHYTLVHGERLLKRNIEHLRKSISEQNLELLPDYEVRLDVLKALEFIDDNGTVRLKGRVACEINTANELVLTELVLENTLAEYEPEEIVSLLSCFVFQERSDNEPSLTPHMEKVRTKEEKDILLINSGQGDGIKDCREGAASTSQSESELCRGRVQQSNEFWPYGGCVRVGEWNAL